MSNLHTLPVPAQPEGWRPMPGRRYGRSCADGGGIVVSPVRGGLFRAMFVAPQGTGGSTDAAPLMETIAAAELAYCGARVKL